jgi:molybdopterin-guanine dinucleotide biosynthesis protein A
MTRVNQANQSLSCSAVILAGGQSRRMGVDKATLQTNGRKHIEIIEQKLHRIVNDVWVVRQFEQTKLDGVHNVLWDLRTDEGPLAGLEAALIQCHTPWLITVAVDNPTVEVKLLTLLQQEALLSERHQAVVPIWYDKVYPLPAVYHKSCLPSVQNCLNRGIRRFRDLIHSLDTTYLREDQWERVDPDHQSFRVLNTKEDYQQLQSDYQGREL